MINPYDSHNRFIMVNPKYNQPTYFGSRVNSTYTCGILSNIKRKIIIRQHNYKTNGVGLKALPNITYQIPYNTRNSVQIGNIIYMVPARFCRFIDEIRDLAKERFSFQVILNKISEKYGVIDSLLLKTQSANLKHGYTYPSFNKQYVNYKNVANFSAPFKMGELINQDDPTVNFSLFPIRSQIRHIYVVCNDGIEYTKYVKDLKQNGKASFWGGKLSSKGQDLMPNKEMPIVVFPIEDTKNIMFGKLYTSNTSEDDSTLIFIPLTTLQNFPIHKKYYENMTFNIKTYDCYENIHIDYNVLRCKYINYSKLYANYL